MAYLSYVFSPTERQAGTHGNDIATRNPEGKG